MSCVYLNVGSCSSILALVSASLQYVEEDSYDYCIVDSDGLSPTLVYDQQMNMCMAPATVHRQRLILHCKYMATHWQIQIAVVTGILKPILEPARLALNQLSFGLKL